MSITQLVSVLALVTTIGGGSVGGYMYLDTNFAKKEEVASNSQAIMLIQIRNAKASKNWQLWQSLCDDFRRIHKWTPRACER